MIGTDLSGAYNIGHSSETEHSEWAELVSLNSEIQETINLSSILK